MPDIVDTELPDLLSLRLPDLDLGPGAVHPAYAGQSILNLTASLGRWFGPTLSPHPPLTTPGLDSLASGARQIVLCLVDAVSLERFRRWAEGPAAGLRHLIDEGLLAPLTSVVPSTTTSALTSLWTGRSPAEHGIVGYELLLRDLGLIANMITLSPATLETPRGLLERAGLRPESLLPVPTLTHRLNQAGIEVHAFVGNSIRASGLSRMHYSGATLHGFGSPADLWQGVRDTVEARPQPRLVWAYYSGVDALSHIYSPDSVQVEVEFAHFVHAMLDVFIQRLARPLRRETLLLLFADHGQVATTPSPHFELRHHPELTRRLHLPPTGEARHAYLYLRPGQAEAVEEYLERTWPGAFSTIHSDHALDSGLYGPGTPDPATAGRLGDRVVLGRGSAYLWWSSKEDALLGRHGSVSADEMLVPLLAFRVA